MSGNKRFGITEFVIVDVLSSRCIATFIDLSVETVGLMIHEQVERLSFIGWVQMIPIIDNMSARNLFLHRQGLGDSPTGMLTQGALLDLIVELGFVQVDSIKTVERAHHMILRSRRDAYRPHLLQTLLEEERRLFENWTHDASIIPSVFYPYWRRRFKREAESLLTRWRMNRREGFESELKKVVRHVKKHGPVMARELKAKGKHATEAASGGWWDWHPSKTALEYLWRTGKLAVCGRQGFQKVYDLAERVLPDSAYTQRVSDRQFVNWACASALDRLGTATVSEITQFWGALAPEEGKAWCQRQPRTQLMTVKVESANGAPPRTSYIRPQTFEALSSLRDVPERLRIISPFDPVVRDRKRCERLFDFEFRIEVFVPAPKRRYGYYVFPLLERNSFVGRVDIKADRERDALVVLGLWPEAAVTWTPARAKGLDAELNRIRRYLSLGDICYDN